LIISKLTTGVKICDFDREISYEIKKGARAQERGENETDDKDVAKTLVIATLETSRKAMHGVFSIWHYLLLIY
jgi:hypothetical protein